MRYPLLCPTCFGPNDEPPEIVEVEVRDDGWYRLTCPHGHESVTHLRCAKFEVLFEFGARALLDSDAREAVVNFAASLERFFEFYIRVILHKRGVTRDVFAASWKHVSAQSER